MWHTNTRSIAWVQVNTKADMAESVLHNYCNDPSSCHGQDQGTVKVHLLWSNTCRRALSDPSTLQSMSTSIFRFCLPLCTTSNILRLARATRTTSRLFLTGSQVTWGPWTSRQEVLSSYCLQDPCSAHSHGHGHGHSHVQIIVIYILRNREIHTDLADWVALIRHNHKLWSQVMKHAHTHRHRLRAAPCVWRLSCAYINIHAYMHTHTHIQHSQWPVVCVSCWSRQLFCGCQNKNSVSVSVSVTAAQKSCVFAQVCITVAWQWSGAC